MYGLPASQTAPTQMYGSPQPLYSSAPAGMGQHQPHQQTRPSPNYPQFRAPGAAYVVLLQCLAFSVIIIIMDLFIYLFFLQASLALSISPFALCIYIPLSFLYTFDFSCHD